ncbi:MAG: hypothetical protein ABI024_01160 [Vicinamibacterales bacterium]
MTRFMVAFGSAVVISGASLLSQAQAPAPSSKGTQILTTQGKADAKNLIEDVKTAGCVRLWNPAPDDPSKMPADRQPGLAGIYLLTPAASSSLTDAGLPTYLLTPSATVNFAQHVGKRVEITGTAQTAPLPPTVQEIATEPPQRPENKPSTNGMPRLTVTTLKRVGEGCP